MASKMQKLVLVALAVFVFQSISVAQTTTDWGWNWKDSSVVPVKKMPQYNEFLNNSFPYPPKPRNQWELGLSIGNSYVLGDRSILTKGYNGGIVGSITFRKALGHVVSIRPGYTGSIIHIPGTGVQGAVNQLHAWNYAHIIGTDLLFSLNNLSYYRGNPKTDWYVLAGYSLIATKVETLRNDGNRRVLYYPQSNILTTFGGNTVNGRKGWAVIQAYNIGFGFSYKLNNKFNIGVEQKFVVPIFNNDYLDGYAIGGNKDIFSFSTLHVNINL